MEWLGPPTLAEREQRHAEVEADLAEIRAAVADLDRYFRGLKLLAVQQFRDALPAHSRGWFDGLSYEEQVRVARPIPPRNDDYQADYDFTDSYRGWPES